MSATSNPSSPYGLWLSTVPFVRTTTDVVGDPALVQFTDAT
jgi:hypothetical protein